MKKILIIGNGLAGLSAAIEVAEAGHRAVIVAPQDSAHAASVLACDGIAAAATDDAYEDSPSLHCEDTLRAARNLADPAAVRGMTAFAPALLRGLCEVGALFSRDANGHLLRRRPAGHSASRVAFADGLTGRQLVCALEQCLRSHAAEGRIEYQIGCRLVRPVLDQGHCVGGVLLHEATGEFFAVTGDALIAASGGMHGLLGNTLGGCQSDGSATAALLASGAQLMNAEMIQFHPLTATAGTRRVLLPDAALEQGGRLYVSRDGVPWYFLEDWYPEQGYRLHREKICRAMHKACTQAVPGTTVYLDLSNVPGEAWRGALRETMRLCRTTLRIDPQKQPIPVRPGAQAFLGGLRVDAKHRTNIPGLYAAGECCCRYHGAGLLTGNATLSAIYGGGLAATAAVAESGCRGNTAMAAAAALADVLRSIHRNRAASGKDALDCRRAIRSLRGSMDQAMGVSREAATLRTAIEVVDWLSSRDEHLFVPPGLHAAAALDAQHLLLLGKVALHSALARRESRGVHFRADFPEQDDQRYSRATLATAHWRDVSVRFCPVRAQK